MPLLASLDFETTGFRPERDDRIVEFGLVILTSDFKVVRQYQSLVNPGRYIPKAASKTHGLNDDSVKDAPRFHEIVSSFVEAMQGVVSIVGHNINFDLRFLKSEFEKCGLSIPFTPHNICTYKLAKQLRVGRDHKLGTVAKALRIKWSGDQHSALADALMAAKVLAALGERVELKLPGQAICLPRGEPSGKSFMPRETGILAPEEVIIKGENDLSAVTIGGKNKGARKATGNVVRKERAQRTFRTKIILKGEMSSSTKKALESELQAASYAVVHAIEGLQGVVNDASSPDLRGRLLKIGELLRSVNRTSLSESVVKNCRSKLVVLLSKLLNHEDVGVQEWAWSFLVQFGERSEAKLISNYLLSVKSSCAAVSESETDLTVAHERHDLAQKLSILKRLEVGLRASVLVDIALRSDEATQLFEMSLSDLLQGGASLRKRVRFSILNALLDKCIKLTNSNSGKLRLVGVHLLGMF